jgi:hypothetical protein
MEVSGQRHAPGKGHPVPIVQEAGWAPEPVWTAKLLPDRIFFSVDTLIINIHDNSIFIEQTVNQIHIFETKLL